MNRGRLFFVAVCLVFGASIMGCTKHQIETKSQVEVAPIEVKPIHITIDVNLRIERALNDVFKDIDEVETQETSKGGKVNGK
ncbi:hypothetical protein DBT_2276 [Dissulfuribacter thermophilus]|uniref:Lipoprotein n=1 Tax=Dissulfuribacter thermophilus TaxID=1156395 RepID=A0A1B9F2X8_9BACT|nr:hypothetical protein [Dissulfuribacter thermophilus]OCC14287.1 hypothetical protein DBT_2276 [Dissulfuribacter thermophilus]